MSEYKLHQGDCLSILPTIESASIDLIATDLPYGTTACEWDSIIPFAPMWEQVKRILKPRGAFVTTASQPFTSALVMSNPKWFKYEWVWIKNKSSGFLNCKNAPMKKSEDVLVFSSGVTANRSKRNMAYFPQGIKKVDKPLFRYKNKDDGAIGNRPSRDGVYVRKYENYPNNLMYFDLDNNQTHPTQKPVALYEYLIRTYTNPGDTVLDFCFGSGTTIVAALNTGRKAIGIERDATYFKIAEKRISQAAPERETAEQERMKL